MQFYRAKLIFAVQSIVAASGSPNDFDASAWVNEWIRQPLPALGGRTPAEYLDCAEGCDLLIRLLAQSAAGVFV
jgi:uncharacterized protein (DUF2384 family)